MSFSSTYQFPSFNGRPWENIEIFFSTLFPGERYPMVELVQHIRSSGLDKRLFGGTSLDRLIISIYEDISPQKDALHIQYHRATHLWHFKYFAMPFREPEFVRTYPANKGIEKFDNFIQLIGW